MIHIFKREDKNKTYIFIRQKIALTENEKITNISIKTEIDVSDLSINDQYKILEFAKKTLDKSYNLIKILPKRVETKKSWWKFW